MDTKKNEPIRLSENETEMLTKALLDAQAQAEGSAVEGDTQLFRRSAVDARARKTGNTQQVQKPNNDMAL
jgi:hypothetical protein